MIKAASLTVIVTATEFKAIACNELLACKWTKLLCDLHYNCQAKPSLLNEMSQYISSANCQICKPQKISPKLRMNFVVNGINEWAPSWEALCGDKSTEARLKPVCSVIVTC